jgi:hypothetical protein
MSGKDECKVEVLPLAPVGGGANLTSNGLRSPVGVKCYTRKRKLSSLSASPTTTSPSSSPSHERNGSRAKWADILKSLETPDEEGADEDVDEDDASKAKSAQAGPRADDEKTPTANDDDVAPSPTKKRKAVQMQLLQFCLPSSPLRSPSKLRSSNKGATPPPASSRDGAKPQRKRTRRDETASSGSTGTRQMYLDLGQERFDWVTCGVCEMTYAPGVPSDEKTHTAFHQRWLKALTLNNTISSNINNKPLGSLV